ncbi:ABC transporter ATP-binding protein [Chitinophaga lutea]
MPSPLLTFRSVQKSYPGGSPVLEIAHLDLNPGLYWLQGHNGAGKTTLFKTIAGLLPFDGEILVNGSKDLRRMANYAEAEPLYPAFLTGRDLTELYRKTKGGDKAVIKDISKQLGVDAFVQNPVSAYSSGMLKKLSLLLAFTGNPALVLLDEPLSTIDTATVDVLYSLLRSQKDRGMSFLITSHQPLDPARITVDGTLSIVHRNLVLH